METSEGSQFVSASSIQEDMSTATSLTAEEVVAQAAEIIWDNPKGKHPKNYHTEDSEKE